MVIFISSSGSKSQMWTPLKLSFLKKPGEKHNCKCIYCGASDRSGSWNRPATFHWYVV